MRKFLSSAISLDTKIYRVMSLEYFTQMLMNCNNVLVKTKLWEDPYENFLYKLQINTKNIIGTAENLTEQIFGQCWSLDRDSDAIWRIYSPDKKSIQIQTTIQKLYDSVYLDDSCMATTFIGDIRYMDNNDLDQWIINNGQGITMSDFSKLYTKSLFLKRDAFKHENEIRVIYTCDSNDKQRFEKTKSYSIQLDQFIEGIVVDPRTSKEYYEVVKILCKKYSLSSQIISKSKLYDFQLNQKITLK